MVVVAALLFAVALAVWSYRFRLDEGAIRIAAIARAVGIGALLLLLLDPGLVARLVRARPVVLLDNSISMHAAQAQGREARVLAASLGDTTSFGELVAGEPGGRSDIATALTGAVAGGRPVVIVTDGEIDDLSLVPPDLIAQATVRALPRRAGDDVALTAVNAPQRIAAGDTLSIEVEALATGTAPDSSVVEVRDGDRVVMRGALRFGGASRARLRLAAVLPAGIEGERWLTVERSGSADAEPGDDVRVVKVIVLPSPGVVVLASAPDWDARFLYRAMSEVVESAVRGYVQLEAGEWRRMDDLRPVSAADVMSAARSADLLAVRGDTTPWRTSGRARLLWAPVGAAGDWYLAPAGASPVAGAFAGVDTDSLPPAAAATALPAGSVAGWIGVNAKLSRRGSDVPVIGGRDGPNGRTVVIGADGLYRWAFRGGASDQAWRTLVSDATAWLLASPDRGGARARVIDPVTQRGRPVRFRWSGDGAPAPIAINLDAAGAARSDTLRFDGQGEAAIALPEGRYRYTLDGGGAGTFAVEAYSDELVPAPVSLAERAAEFTPAPVRRSLRDMLWLFGVAVAGFGSEWMMRRKVGLT